LSATKTLNHVEIQGNATLLDTVGSDGAGARQRKITLQGKTLAGVLHTLLEVIAQHEGSAADQKAEVKVYLNDGNDGTSPTLVVTIASTGVFTFAQTPAGIATEAFVTAAVAAAVVGLLDDKGNTDCSGNPNYPAALKGDIYTVSVAGKIGGASGVTVEVGDTFRAIADNAGGTQGAVGSSWAVLQANLVGALVSGGPLGMPSSGDATNLINLPVATGISGLAAGIAAFLATPSGANLAAALTSALPISAGGTGQATAYAGLDALTVKGADIASAATTDLAAATGMVNRITGTATIASFGTAAAGVLRVLHFAGAAVLTFNATSMQLPGGANITTAAGDMAIFVSMGSGNWHCTAYSPAGQLPIARGGTGAATVIAAIDALHAKSADIVAASTTDLATATGEEVDITGSTTITAFGTCAAGVVRRLRFTGAPLITHNATSLICPSASNIQTAAGDTMEVVSLGSGNWFVCSYQSGLGQESWLYQNGDFTMATGNSLTKLFNASTNGGFTLPTGTYFFEAHVSLGSMSTNNENGKVNILGAGTATLAGQRWRLHGVDGTHDAISAMNNGVTVTGNETPSPMLSTTTTGEVHVIMVGTFRVTVAGTIIPSFAPTTSSTPVNKDGGYFRLRRIGDTSFAARGLTS
jgi:hypothetical protein